MDRESLLKVAEWVVILIIMGGIYYAGYKRDQLDSALDIQAKANEWMKIHCILKNQSWNPYPVNWIDNRTKELLNESAQSNKSPGTG